MTHTARELAEFLQARLEGDGTVTLAGVASPERARPEDLIYVESERHRARALRSAARCVLAPDGLDLPGVPAVVRVGQPRLAFARAAAWLVPAPPLAVGVHPTAIVAATARLAPTVALGPYVVVEDGAEIDDQVQIAAFCFVGRGARLGPGCRLYPRVTLYPGVRLGARVTVHAGAVIGSDGFGYVRTDSHYEKFPQLGTVDIGDDVEIGANTTIDRGALDATTIGPGTKLDNLVHIAHNVRIGAHTIIAAQTGISGSSQVGSGVVLGGQVGIADHCTLEDGCVVGAQAGIPTGKTIRSGQFVWGTPARPMEKFKQQYAWFARLPELAERIRRLEQQR
ncbi:MAG: UDP-3-O-(3-hydroxymyristoyl)glucosamine N-acyltransferase [Acidobacteriia bacterium]|jgi:UDP-3-O-[3-hydroxymyristoyl] glucosamine N-acyltransferase|nr:UDP-3-O-(3-hydroxymyristoyl)glucosamine N-acyltransferase [Terriglobia bacterium]